MVRLFSSFAVQSRMGSSIDGVGDMADHLPPELADIGGVDEGDPRELGKWLRKAANAAGEPLPPELEEVCGRLEAGEDPEQIEDEMGETLERGLGGYEEDDTLYEA